MRNLIIPAAFLFAVACEDAQTQDAANASCDGLNTVEMSIGDETYRWSDPDATGEMVGDTLMLPADSEVEISLRFLEEAGVVTEHTEEILAASDEHQVFYGGGAPVDFLYDDMDALGLNVGLQGRLRTGAPGTGTLVVHLRHFMNDVASDEKFLGLEDVYSATGKGGLPGVEDVEAVFDVRIQ